MLPDLPPSGPSASGRTTWVEDIDYRGKVRSRSPETSWDAAKLQTNRRVSAVQAAIQGILAQHPEGLTHEQICDLYEAWRWLNADCPAVTEQSVRTRVHDLVVCGAIVNTGRTRPSRRGNRSVIWNLRSEVA